MTTMLQPVIVKNSQQTYDAEKTCIYGTDIYFKVPPHNIDSNELGNRELQNLQRQRKLCLVLDLDHTLLHTTLVDELSREERRKANDSLDDFYRWEFMGVEHVTKLRPYVRKFLEEANMMFEMYVYTMGTREYALHMAKILDPDSVYFSSRIISREDNTVRGLKGLDVVPVHESGVLILDDTPFVWTRNLTNLIPIIGYSYFGCKSLVSEEGMDESESTGPLSCASRLLQVLHCLYYDWYQGYDVREMLEYLRNINKQNKSLG